MPSFDLRSRFPADECHGREQAVFIDYSNGKVALDLTREVRRGNAEHLASCVTESGAQRQRAPPRRSDSRAEASRFPVMRAGEKRVIEQEQAERDGQVVEESVIA